LTTLTPATLKETGAQHLVFIGQNVKEAEIAGSAEMIGLIRAEIGICRVCRQGTYITRASRDLAGKQLYLVCIGCAGEAVERFSNFDPEIAANMKKLSAAYRVAITKKQGGEG
jgi:hypothetical protein